MEVKNITFAPRKMIGSNTLVEEELMAKVFDFSPNQYLLTDESQLSDMFPRGVYISEEIFDQGMDAAMDFWDEKLVEKFQRLFGIVVKPSDTVVAVAHRIVEHRRKRAGG